MTLIRPVARLVVLVTVETISAISERNKTRYHIKPPPELSRGRARVSVEPIEISSQGHRERCGRKANPFAALPRYMTVLPEWTAPFFYIAARHASSR